MNKFKLIFIALLITAVGLVASFLKEGKEQVGEGQKPILLFCAAGMKQPITEIAKMYQDEYGIEVQLQFAGSGSLLGNLDITPGDLYLAADESYVKIAQEKGYVQESIPVSFLRAGIAVPAGNPKQIKSLEDLKRSGLRIGVAVPDAASVGKFTKKVLSKHGLWEELEPKVHLMAPTVNELANALKLGTVDAAIIWDAIANQYPEIDFVKVPEFETEIKQITMGVLTKSTQPTEALRFIRYVSARDRGLPVFKKAGYEIIDGDRWSRNPDIVLYSGSMLRPAISHVLKAFQEREGVKIRSVYNGCGVLVSQMKAGENPDAYFSCDVKFMDMVEDRFMKPVTVSGNDMVILVPKQNEKGIATLSDLAKPGIRVGFAHPEKSALGFLTKYMLEQKSLYRPILDAGNLQVDSATGDYLVTQLRAGSLDAVIVYRSNAKAHPNTLEDCSIIDITAENATAFQPYAVGRNSDYKFIMKRFFDQVTSKTGKKSFMSYGFNWELH